MRAEYHALSYTLGPFGRQDIHLHPRIDRESKVDVLVGFGRTCDRTPGRLHAQLRQTEGSTWWKAGHEGEPLDGPVGLDPPLPAVATLCDSAPSRDTDRDAVNSGYSGRTYGRGDDS